MKTYIAYLKQAGEGCDYTIGCGRTVIDISANSMDEAQQKLVEIIADNYSHDETMLKTAVIYEVLQLNMVDIKVLYQKIINDRNSEIKRIEEEKERQEFERLKSKYGK